jgi:hypothetical protein
VKLYKGLPLTGMTLSRQFTLGSDTTSIALNTGEDGSIAEFSSGRPNTPYLYSVPHLWAMSPSMLLVPRDIAISDGLTTYQTPPGAPTNFTAIAYGSQINLAWRDVWYDQTGFALQRQTGSNAFVTLANLAAAITNYTDATVLPTNTYTYRLLATNSYGVSPGVTVSVSTGNRRYVWGGSSNPTAPYLTWATAAHTIQDAVNACTNGDEVLVTNGVYATGGSVVYGASSNRISITRAIRVHSANGAAATAIVGQGPCGSGAVRCAYVGANAILSGFTLTNGCTRSAGDVVKEQSGGGAWCEKTGSLKDCVMVGCSAVYQGGGAYGGTLNNCLAHGNTAAYGGGCFACNAHNCTLADNAATSAGGAGCATLNNCIVCSNTAGSSSNYDGACVLQYCCAQPLAA